MNITKKKLKSLIKEEYFNMMGVNEPSFKTLTENEKLVFRDILGRLAPEQLQEYGIKKIS